MKYFIRICLKKIGAYQQFLFIRGKIFRKKGGMYNCRLYYRVLMNDN